jgi:hypothetical protein
MYFLEVIPFTPSLFHSSPPIPNPIEFMLSAIIEPTDWTLAISPERQAAVGQTRAADPNNWGRWNADINRLCLETILPWLRAEYLPTATLGLDSSLMPMIWDVVTGVVISVGTKRIALIPTEAIDRSGLEVPQEWVDIPSWVADYYVAVQVDRTAGAIYIYGYTTHRQLKTQGGYDPIDRTYCLDGEELNADLNALWLTLDRYPQTATRAALAPIPTIASERVTPLIDRLSNPTEIIPRLAVPFELWAAIVDRSDWLQQLYLQRQMGRSIPTVTRLSDWLQGRIDVAWQALELVLLPPQIATTVRGDRSIPTPSNFYRAKVYSFAAGQIALAIGISPISDTESRIGLQIHPAGGSTQLPGATQLRLSAAGSEIGHASATATETIQFQFRASVRERFEIEIDCGGETRVESFEL